MVSTPPIAVQAVRVCGNFWHERETLSLAYILRRLESEIGGPLSISFGEVTRGSGKVYQLVDAEVAQGDTVEAVSSINGVEMPCFVAPLSPSNPGHLAVVVPAMKTKQDIVVRIVRNGEVLEEASKSLSHASAALNSKFNTFRKNTAVEGARNCDVAGLASEARIQPVLASLSPEHGEYVLRFTADTFASEADAFDGTFEVSLFDRDGNDISHSLPTLLGDKVTKTDSGSALISLDFSIRVPADLGDYIIWLKFSSTALADGFYVSLVEQTHEFISNCRNTMVYNSGVGPRYQDWFNLRHKASALEIEAQKGTRFEIEPLFSIIVPLFKTPLNYFQEMLDSVLAQSYGKFELILVNASPEDAELCAAAEGATVSDDRVRVITLEDNYGITVNTNYGIEAARGDFLAFFDHDDLIEPNLLFEYVKAINSHPDTDLLYCDEDKTNDDGLLYSCLLKPDFDWSLICACNSVTHLLTVRKSIVDSFDQLPDKRYDGSQDHNMTLLVAEKARNIYHVRKVLYHWRVHPGSTAAGPGEKPWTQESGRIAVQEHLDRMGVDAVVTDHPTMANFYSVDYRISAPAPRVSIVIPNKDCSGYLRRCVDSIYRKSDYSNFEVIVVENNSVEPETFTLYEELKAQYHGIRVVSYEGPFNFSKICNYGASFADGSLLLFLNNDTEVISADWLTRMVGQMQREKVGVVGAKLLYPDDTVQHLGVVFPRSFPEHVGLFQADDDGGYFGFQRFPMEYSAVTGACLMMRKREFDELSGFDEEFAVSYNDVDLCLRVRDGGKLIVIEPRACLRHYESVSRGYDNDSKEKELRFARERARLLSMHPDIFVADPYYNVNCERGSRYFQLGWD